MNQLYREQEDLLRKKYGIDRCDDYDIACQILFNENEWCLPAVKFCPDCYSNIKYPIYCLDDTEIELNKRVAICCRTCHQFNGWMNIQLFRRYVKTKEDKISEITYGRRQGQWVQIPHDPEYTKIVYLSK